MRLSAATLRCVVFVKAPLSLHFRMAASSSIWAAGSLRFPLWHTGTSNRACSPVASCVKDTDCCPSSTDGGTTRADMAAMPRYRAWLTGSIAAIDPREAVYSFLMSSHLMIGAFTLVASQFVGEFRPSGAGDSQLHTQGGRDQLTNQGVRIRIPKDIV